MDYDKTLNLPEMSLPIEIDSSKIESRVLSFWEDLNVYAARQRINGKSAKILVHNPPVSASRHVCLDDALSMILKDRLLDEYNN